jgi:hypothetical protein
MKRWTVMFICFSAIAVLLLSGCAIVDLRSSKLPGADISELKTFHVVANDEDPGKVHENVRDALIEMGFEATSGPKSETPANVDALVSYDDRWFWDMGNYMIELNLIIREPDMGYPMAEGESIRTSLARKEPKEMAKEILESLFNPKSDAK